MNIERARQFLSKPMLLKSHGTHNDTGSRFGKGTRIVGYAVVLCLVLLTLASLLDRWYASRYNTIVTKTRASSPLDSGTLNVTEVSAPAQVSIFGEQVPMDHWEVRERFEREFYYNLGNPDQLLLYWKRAQRYFPKIEKALKDAGIPDDFKYLMVAESGIRNIKSPAGANGFWQFIQGTGMKYGLRVDDQIDERMDPDLATQAAIRYLEKMRTTLPSWILVAAGYNMGEDNVRVAMDWQHQANYWNLYLNDETMRYILRIAVIKELLEHGEKYKLDFVHAMPYHEPQFRTVVVEGPIPSISDWAQTQGYAYKDVKMFNPWLIGRMIPEGTFTLKLPATDLDRTTLPK
jgi:hypothetical protein